MGLLGGHTATEMGAFLRIELGAFWESAGRPLGATFLYAIATHLVHEHARRGSAPMLQGASDDYGSVHARKVLQRDATTLLHSEVPSGWPVACKFVLKNRSFQSKFKCCSDERQAEVTGPGDKFSRCCFQAFVEEEVRAKTSAIIMKVCLSGRRDRNFFTNFEETDTIS